MTFDPSVLLSPHVFLLGILFRHRAFRSEPLNDSPDKLSTINIFKGEDELLLPLKEELRDVCVFPPGQGDSYRVRNFSGTTLIRDHTRLGKAH